MGQNEQNAQNVLFRPPLQQPPPQIVQYGAPPNREVTVQDVYGLLLGIQNNMAGMRTDMDNRLHQLNISVAELGTKMENLNTRVEMCEHRMNVVEDNTTEKLGTVNTKLNDITVNMTQRLAHMENVAGAAAQIAISSIVVKNVPENPDETPEILRQSVTNLFNTLDPGEYTITNLYRVGDAARRPRVTIVEMGSSDDCQKILRKKSKLKDSNDYKGVYIENNRPRHERQMEFNMRKLCKNLPNVEYRRGRVHEK